MSKKPPPWVTWVGVGVGIGIGSGITNGMSQTGHPRWQGILVGAGAAIVATLVALGIAHLILKRKKS